ncbi:MAG: hypothetical protein AAFP19_01170 [Bacteroidota bacterium]
MCASVKKVRVRIGGDNQGVEISIIDNKFTPVERGMGVLWTELEPGFYKAEYRFGKTIRKELFSVESGQSFVELKVPAFRKTSALPLTDPNSESQAAKRDAGFSFHKNTVEHYGQESALYLLVGGWNQKEDRSQDGEEMYTILQSFSLYNLEGKRLHQFGRILSPNLSYGYLGERIELDHGKYILHIDDEENERYLAQLIYVPRFRETQLYYYIEGNKSYSESLSIMIVDKGDFDPKRYHFDVAEAAINGLRYNMDGVAKADMRRMLSGKFQNPMLGLYWLYLQLRYVAVEEINWNLVETVLRNTSGMIGEMPDVQVLQLWMRLHTEEEDRSVIVKDYTFPEPPMIAIGWDLMLQIAEDFPDLIPFNSTSARIAEKLWHSSVWTMWTTQSADAEEVLESWQPKHSATDIEQNLEPLPLASFMSSLYQKKVDGQLTKIRLLNDQENKLLDYFLAYPLQQFYSQLLDQITKNKSNQLLKAYAKAFIRLNRGETKASLQDWLLRVLVLDTWDDPTEALWTVLISHSQLQSNEQLKEDCRMLIRNIDLEKLTYKEMAKQWQLPKHSIQQLVLRLNAKLDII